MGNWTMIPLGEVAEVGAGDPAPQKKEDFSEIGTPFVRMQDVGRYGHTRNLSETRDRLSRETSKRFKLFPAGSILIPKSGASIRLNHRAILGVDAHVVSHLAVITAKPSLDNHFLYYYLCSKDLSGLAHQADLPSMKVSELAKLPIPLPSLSEQQRLVRILDVADALRQLRARADARTNDFIPALFNEMFGDPATNPKGWKVFANQELFAKDRAGTKCGPFGSALKKHEYVENGIPVWGIDNVLPNEFVEEGSLFITRKKFQQLENYGVEPGDILISRAGTVGRMCVAHPKQSPSIIGSNLIRLSFDQNKIVPEYFTTLFTYSPQATSRFRANSDEGAYSFMNTGTLKTLSIPVPPLALQLEFAARVAEVRALQAQQARSRQRLEDLFQALLHRAFAGEL